MSITLSCGSFAAGKNTQVTIAVSGTDGPDLTQCSVPAASYIPNGSPSSTAWAPSSYSASSAILASVEIMPPSNVSEKEGHDLIPTTGTLTVDLQDGSSMYYPQKAVILTDTFEKE